MTEAVAASGADRRLVRFEASTGLLGVELVVVVVVGGVGGIIEAIGIWVVLPWVRSLAQVNLEKKPGLVPGVLDPRIAFGSSCQQVSCWMVARSCPPTDIVHHSGDIQ